VDNMDPLMKLKELKEDINIGNIQDGDLLKEKYDIIISLVWENITN